MKEEKTSLIITVVETENYKLVVDPNDNKYSYSILNKNLHDIVEYRGNGEGTMYAAMVQMETLRESGLKALNDYKTSMETLKKGKPTVEKGGLKLVH